MRRSSSASCASVSGSASGSTAMLSQISSTRISRSATLNLSIPKDCIMEDMVDLPTPSDPSDWHDNTIFESAEELAHNLPNHLAPLGDRDRTAAAVSDRRVGVDAEAVVDCGADVGRAHGQVFDVGG